MKSETDYQSELKKRIKARFPGATILKNDPLDIQGIPDLTILYKKHWAMLEVKREEKARKRPNQGKRVEYYNKQSFASFISPETEEEVLDAMARSFGNRRTSRLFKSEQENMDIL